VLQNTQRVVTDFKGVHNHVHTGQTVDRIIDLCLQLTDVSTFGSTRSVTGNSHAGSHHLSLSGEVHQCHQAPAVVSVEAEYKLTVEVCAIVAVNQYRLRF